MKTTVVFAFFLLIPSTSLSAKIPSEITLATTNWPPYTSGSSPDKPGIVYEYITEILAKNGITLRIERYPWSRAIKMANDNNDIHGLLTAVYEEAPKLLFTRTPVMNYKVNFYTAIDNHWLYQDQRSLNSMPSPLCIILGYGYGSPIDEFIHDEANKTRLHILTGGNAQQRLVKMLEYKRVAVIIEDELVIESYTKKSTNIRFAGTLSDSPFYVAFNPNLSWSNDIVALLNQELADPENLQRLQQLVSDYTSKQQ
ncbi:substrate-binding periplasmic protein [Shewanella sp. HL-SH4]|uniref:substrate-binding periplasmic protein n=1 Tax=Shewanella sp. HL-SH4 TaxID=3436240 RepID=UPI003EB6CDDF